MKTFFGIFFFFGILISHRNFQVSSELSPGNFLMFEKLLNESSIRSERRIIAELAVKMEMAIADSERRIIAEIAVKTEKAIADSERRTTEFVVKMLRDESHLFIKESVREASLCVAHLGQAATGFGVIYGGNSYVVVPAHMEGPTLRHSFADVALLNPSSELYNVEKIGFFNLDGMSAIATPAVGDTLHAIGFDDEKPHIGVRIWVGSVYALYHENTTQFSVDMNGVTQPFKYTLMLTGGDAVNGMSGAPVFNGCGLSGISVGVDMRSNYKFNEKVFTLSGALIVHVSHLLELFGQPDAAKFIFPSSERSSICKIPIKSYCS
jgi:hypothetical protein